MLGAIKRTGQKWEEELVRTVADARGGGVLAKAQYLNAHVRWGQTYVARHGIDTHIGPSLRNSTSIL